MPSRTSPLQVRLKVVAIRSRLRVSVSLQNSGAKDLLVLNQEPEVRTGTGGVIHLWAAETPAPRLMFYYAYSPALELVAAGVSRSRRYTVPVSARGHLRVRFTCAYLDAPFIPQTTDPRGDFVRVQKLVRSNVVKVRVR